MKRLLIIFGKSLFIFILLTIGTVLIGSVLIWRHPEWLINTANVQWLLQHYGLQNQIRFQEFDLRAASPSFFEKDLNLRLKGLCVDLQEPHRILFCAESIEFDAPLEFVGWRPRFRADPRLDISGAELDLELRPSPEVQPLHLPAVAAPSFSSWLGFLETWLPGKRWGKLQADLRRMDLRLNPQWRMQGSARLSSLDKPHQLELASQLQLESPLTAKELPVDLKAGVDLRLPEARLTLDAPNFQGFHAELVLSQDLSIKLLGERRSQAARILLDSNLRWRGSDLKLENRLNVRVDSLPIPSRRRRRPPQFEVLHRLAAHPRLDEQRWRVDWQQDLEAPKISGLEVKVAAQGRLDLRGQSEAEAGRPLDWNQALQVELIEGRVGAHQFAQLARDFAWTTIQVPAPFYRMKGPLDLQFKSDKPTLKQADFKGALRSQLEDGMQALNFDLNFMLSLQELLGPRPHLKGQAELVLNKIILELPRLSPLSIPQFVMDSRITRNRGTPPATGKIQGGASRFTYELDFKIRTAGAPILLHSNLISNPIPLRVESDMHFQSGRDPRIQAQVVVESMSVELFRRAIQLERIALDRQPNGVTAMNGLFLFQNSEVKVRIRLLGTAEKPQVLFESDPPLSRHQLISIVVFGKSLSELTQEETSSAQNLEQAFTDGALGIFSLVVLASTPIESISYNPVTQSYVARVKLDNSTSVSLGSDFENRQSLAIRRQLWGAWSIKTELESDGVDKDHLSTFLEWFRRF